MWSSEQVATHCIVAVMVGVMGWQDWRTREVSNILSIPLAFAGCAALVQRLLIRDALAPLTLLIIVMITGAALRGWMGGADWKALVGLFGLWPMAGFAALVTAGAWGAIVMINTNDRNVSFPGITAFFIGTVLTFAMEVSIISIHKV